MSNLSASNIDKFVGHSGTTISRVVGSGLKTIVTPASNTNGIIIYRAIPLVGTSGSGCTLSIGTSAPASWLAGSVIAYSWGSVDSSLIEQPIFIPSGYGLYFYPLGTTDFCTTIYEIL